jgi:hypothetical protein
MTSRKGKRQKVAENALARAKALAHIDPRRPGTVPPPGSVMADASALDHNNTYGLLPSFYIDKVVVCRQCGKEEVWPAERQKWWYEVAKGNINTQAVLCRACRAAEKERSDQARKVHLEGVQRKREQ